mmetsp:Transcript_74924/g.231683  ORF Transcript_74924/g.231683 Transcript_74924/m.231683 type:complete len:235 (-) Transcript_74924:905-1609(-)
MLRKACASTRSRSAPPGAATRRPSRLARFAQSAASQAQPPHSTRGHSRSSSSGAKKWYSRQPVSTKTMLAMLSPSTFRKVPDSSDSSETALVQILRTAAGLRRQYTRSIGWWVRWGMKTSCRSSSRRRTGSCSIGSSSVLRRFPDTRLCLTKSQMRDARLWGMLFSLKKCRICVSCSTARALMFLMWFIAPVMLLTNDENITNPQIMTTTLKARSYALWGKISIDAGVNCVKDQ